MSRGRPPSRRSVLFAVAATAAAGGSVASASPGASAARPGPGRRVDFLSWSSTADWSSGTAQGVRVDRGRDPAIALSSPLGVRRHRDPHTGTTEPWEYGVWTSTERPLAVPATEIIASWNAHTPAGTWIQVDLSATYADGTRTPWYVMGRWAAGDEDIRRHSVDGQGDGRSTVHTDVLAMDDTATGSRLTAVRLRVLLHRRPGTAATPLLWRLGAAGSDVPDRFTVPPSPPAGASELAVPRYSQEIHRGRYPEYDDGGEAWCSPASSQMVVEYWGGRVDEEALSWVDPTYTDPQVCHAARHTYDHQYGGCGNWPFNAAYAAGFPGLRAVVTRLESLADLERLVAAGIPVITSQSFSAEELTGAGYGTSGHLMVVVGFTRDGDVIANDPAAPTNVEVRRVYRRREWENVWLRTRRRDAAGRVLSGTGGVCYLYFPTDPGPRRTLALAAVGVH
ncbi:MULTISPECIES: peptidase C39 family protein [unclassified Streptomyces]|uniref:peptidase C39 family protein n=1 Tax=unclassified Streptomyces TaxID=2593676 RepID=UPI001906B3C5|nr:peptidase C39 family protein [Streptomyces sp. HSG2]